MNTIERAMRVALGEYAEYLPHAEAPARATAPTEPEPEPAAASSEPPARPLLQVDFEALRRRGCVMPDGAGGALAEQFQQVKRRLIDNVASVAASESGRPANVVLITSALPGEGKTWFTLNLALSLAREIDRTVLVVDSDGAKADLGRLLGALPRPGLYDALADSELDLADLILRTQRPGLSFLPAGSVRAEATERLASLAMARLAQDLAQRYPDRLILFDAPAVLGASGAAALAAHVGQVLLVVEAGRTSADTVRRALAALTHAPLAGVVLNKQQLPHSMPVPAAPLA